MVRNRWGTPKAGVWVRMGSSYETTNTQGYFRLLLPISRLGTSRSIVLNYWKPHHREPYLTAKVPFDPTRTKPYHIRLKKAPAIRNPGFY